LVDARTQVRDAGVKGQPVEGEQSTAATLGRFKILQPLTKVTDFADHRFERFASIVALGAVGVGFQSRREVD
jgi:hypothetical protein